MYKTYEGETGEVIDFYKLTDGSNLLYAPDLMMNFLVTEGKFALMKNEIIRTTTTDQGILQATESKTLNIADKELFDKAMKDG